MEILIFLIVGLLLWAAIGHGIWVGLEAIWRALFDGKGEATPPKAGPSGDAWEERAAAERQINRLIHRGLLDSRTGSEVIRAIRKQEGGPLQTPAGREREHVAATAAQQQTQARVTPPPPPARPEAPPRPATPEAQPHAHVEAKPQPPAEEPTPQPRRGVADLLAAFMEEGNIRWGELVGGLLIVFCSAALVVSLWTRIAELPVVQVGLFTAITAALFGAGLYTEHRWRLPNTSRGLLVIATLLTPLTFLLISAFGQGLGVVDVRAVAVEAAALTLLGWLLYKAAAIYAPGWAVHVTAGVMGLSAVQLLLRRVTGPELGLAGLWLAGAAPLAVYGGVMGAALRRGARWERLSVGRMRSLLTIFGVSTFATAAAVALFVYLAEDGRTLATQLSALVSLYGLPALVSGLFFWRMRTRLNPSWLAVAGTTVGVLGVAVMGAGIGLAWPQPAYLLPVLALTAGVLFAIAAAVRIAEANGLAGALAVLAYLVAALVLIRPELGWEVETGRALITALLSGEAGRLLVPAAWVLGGAGVLMLLQGQRAAEGQWLLPPAVLAAGASVALVGVHGLGRVGDPQWVAAIYGLYGAAALAGGLVGERVDGGRGVQAQDSAAAQRWGPGAAAQAQAMVWVGTVLVAVAVLQGVVFRGGGSWVTAWLVVATLAAAGLVAAWAWAGVAWEVYRRAATTAVWVSSVPAAALVTAGVVAEIGEPAGAMGVAAWRGAWLGLVWLAVACVGANRLMFTLGQAATAGAVALGLAAWREDAPLLNVAVLQTQAIGLGLVCVAWATLRLLTPPGRTEASWGVRLAGRGDGEPNVRGVVLDRAAALVRPARTADGGGVAFDHVLMAGLVLFLAGMAWAGIVPAVVEEWAPGATPDPAGAVREALGVRAWLLLAMVAGALAVTLRSGPREVARLVPGALVVGGGVTVPLLAAFWADGDAAASAMRWWAAAFLAIGSAVVWNWRTVARGLGRSVGTRWQRAAVHSLVLAIGGLTVVALTVAPAAREVLGFGVAGPGAASVFGRIGDLANYGAPLAVLSAVLIGHGVQERRGAFAYAGGLVGNLAVTLTYLLALMTEAMTTGEHVVRILQVNAAWSGAFALVWVGLTAGGGWSRIRGAGVPAPARGSGDVGWLVWQVGTAGAWVLVFLGPAAGWMAVVEPGAERAVVEAAGQVWGWAAWAVTMAAVWAGLTMARRSEVEAEAAWWSRISSTAGASLVSAAVLLALTVSGVEAAAGFRTLVLGLVIAAWLGELMVTAVAADGPISRPAAQPRGLAVAVRWIVGAAVIGAVLAVRGLFSGLDHEGAAAWWAAGPMVGVAGVLFGLGGLSRLAALREVVGRPARYVWSGLVAMQVASAVMWQLHWGAATGGRVWLTGLLATQAVALLPAVVVSFAIDRPALAARRGDAAAMSADAAGRAAGSGVHLAGAGLGVVAMVLLVAARVLGEPIEPAAWSWLHGGALALVVGMAGLCLWDPRAVYAGHGLYVLLVAAAVLALDVVRPGEAWVYWWAIVGLGVLVLINGGGWATRERWAPMLREGGVAARPAGPLPWLLGATAVVAAVQIILVLRVVMGHAGPPDVGVVGVTAWRVTASAGVFLIAGGLALMATGGRMTGDARTGEPADEPGVRLAPLQGLGGAGAAVRGAALGVGALGAVLFGWAWVDPAGVYAHAVQYAAVALFALVVVTAAYGAPLYRLAIGRRETGWAAALRASVRVLVPTAAVVLAATLMMEVVQYVARGAVLLPGVSVVGVAAALAGAAAVGVWWAVTPRRDPLRLEARWRVGYVYAAEGLIALMFLHVRLTAPWLFAMGFERYWPLIVMGLAFGGLGMGAWFARRGMAVLANPLSQTALFLPLLPVLGFWLTDTPVHYSALLLMVALLYGVMAANRRSFVLSVVAAVAANGALWYALQRTERYGLLDHPQLWLIPLTLCVLAAAYLHRQRLSAQQMGAVRYVCVSLVYLSSTAEMFIQGVADAPWLPLVLMGLSVGGVLAGILLRVQSFLFAGCGFLVLALLTILWYASANLGWTWIWYVAGIGLGVLILLLFAAFEHRRQRMLDGLERVRRWEA